MRTYGTIWLDRGLWHFEVEPHVAMRLKHMFKRIHSQTHGVLTISDSHDICRDIEWFMSRYPLKWKTKADARRLHASADKYREQETLVSKLLSGRKKPQRFELALPAREYQMVAAEMWLAMGGLLIADDIGTGKSATAICGLTDPRTRPALVAAPAHLPRQWQSELAKFAPNLRTHILKKSTPYNLLDKQGNFPDVIISSYHKLNGWAETLAPLIRSVVFDEVQELRTGSSSKKGVAAYRLSEAVKFRAGLSATPINNYGSEFWEVMHALRPNEMGTRDEFVTEWCYGAGYRQPRIYNPKAFGSYLREQGMMIRRTRADVGRELPELTKVPHYVDSDLKPLQDVHSAACELARVILEQKGESVKGEKWRAAEELNNLVRQATGIAKAPYVADFVRMIVEAGESVVLFGWHREVYNLWMERMEDLRPALYTGTESVTQKDESKRRFVEGETKLLIMSLRAGQGVDGLQSVCRTVVHGELDWSPAIHEQNTGRVHRDGQKDPVVSYFLITDSGSDPIITDVLGLKSEQLRGVRDVNVALVEKLDTGGAQTHRLAQLYLKRRREHHTEVE